MYAATYEGGARGEGGTSASGGRCVGKEGGGGPTAEDRPLAEEMAATPCGPPREGHQPLGVDLEPALGREERVGPLRWPPNACRTTIASARRPLGARTARHRRRVGQGVGAPGERCPRSERGRG
jgi:hypothetical protein